MTTIQILTLLSQKGFIDLDPSKEIPNKMIQLENLGYITIFRVEEQGAIGASITKEGVKRLNSLKSYS